MSVQRKQAYVKRILAFQKIGGIFNWTSEWIPYDRFTNPVYMAEGEFDKVYKTTWKDDYILHWMQRIHAKELVNQDLHFGNIACNESSPCVTDIGLCRPINYHELEDAKNNTYESHHISYLASEILRGQNYTKVSDICSFV
ncbi:kinase-like domain-containing protein [Rhizophagus clarus]|uniref:Kinase-like domain-containing protein n=1 Tax=Rhizophagus clarus TaxID=94130 RepID=A0A8H3KR61_9GLOM|nr:kinase-like domain-containing protein [Rhizophagus clarus]